MERINMTKASSSCEPESFMQMPRLDSKSKNSYFKSRLFSLDYLMVHHAQILSLSSLSLTIHTFSQNTYHDD